MREKRKLLLASLVTLGFLLCLELCTAFRIEVRDELEHGQNSSTKTVTRVKRYSRSGSNCDFGRPSERINCGWRGITQSQCDSRKCCYDSRFREANNCFYSNGGRTGGNTNSKTGGSTGTGLKTGSSSGCNWAGCGNTNYASLGELKVDSGRDGTISTFGSKTNTWKNSQGLGASADAHLAHVSNGNKWGSYEGNAGKVGAKVYARLDGVGAEVDATLAEFGGKVGHGPLSIGAKVGLSGDTGFRFGPTNEFKVLGTGVSVGQENGLQTCVFGSCVNVG